MRSTGIIPSGAIALALLAGCASHGGIGVDDWQRGARLGRVSGHYAAAATAATLPACLSGLSAGDYAARHFIKVRYRQVRLMRETVAEVPPDLPLRDGDTVVVWPADCDAGQLARVELPR